MINPINLSVRSTGLEIMDDLDCHGSVVEQTLRELDLKKSPLHDRKATANSTLPKGGYHG